jgi:hypothetical protein
MVHYADPLTISQTVEALVGRTDAQGALTPFRAGFACKSVMLGIALTLIVGFALGYGVREWAFPRDHSHPRQRRPF